MDKSVSFTLRAVTGDARVMLDDFSASRRGTGADIMIRPPNSSLLSFSLEMPEKLVEIVRAQPDHRMRMTRGGPDVLEAEQLAVDQHQAPWPLPNRRPAISAQIVKSDRPATERYSSTVRCSRKHLQEPQQSAQLLNWSGLPPTLTVPAKRADGVRAGGCEPACSPRRYRPLRRSLLVYGTACWPWSSSSGRAATSRSTRSTEP